MDDLKIRLTACSCCAGEKPMRRMQCVVVLVNLWPDGFSHIHYKPSRGNIPCSNFMFCDKYSQFMTSSNSIFIVSSENYW